MLAGTLRVSGKTNSQSSWIPPTSGKPSHSEAVHVALFCVVFLGHMFVIYHEISWLKYITATRRNRWALETRTYWDYSTWQEKRKLRSFWILLAKKSKDIELPRNYEVSFRIFLEDFWKILVQKAFRYQREITKRNNWRTRPKLWTRGNKTLHSLSSSNHTIVYDALVKTK